MIVSRTSPVEEDGFIDRLINQMEGKLLPIWEAQTSEAKFYGRVVLIDNKPFWFNGESHVDVLSDSRYKFISYVECDPNVTFQSGRHKVRVSLACQAKLTELYPSITHRADAELREDVRKVLFERLDDQTNYLGYEVVNSNEIKDMQPYYTVKFKFVISY